MKPKSWRHDLLLLFALPLLVFAGSRVSGAAAPAGQTPAQLTLVATTDLKGRTSPCGCHTPKGGFARTAHVLDSLLASGSAFLYVDAGGAFPDQDGRPDLAEFMYRSLHEQDPAGVGVGPRDLRLGVQYLQSLARATKLPVLCANLLDRASGKPLFPGTRVVTVRGVKVGLFALIGERWDLGPAKDSVTVTDPENAAHAAVASLRSQGAQVIVLLSQLGKVGGEDLAASVPGIHAVILGHDVPILERGRRVGGAMLSYSGELGQHLGVVRMSLDTAGRPDGGDVEVRALGPDVREQPAMLTRVKAFEDAFNERMRKEMLAMRGGDDQDSDPVDHFVGVAVCERCHEPQAAQWRTTAHSIAWETLVRERKDATPECITCHVVGFNEPGGFRTAHLTPGLMNVQCENCHGVGTQHREGWLSQISPLTCQNCHRDEHDPEFDFEKKMPLVTHSNTSGESIRLVKERRERNRAAGSH
jgi:hypothetical protein